MSGSGGELARVIPFPGRVDGGRDRGGASSGRVGAGTGEIGAVSAAGLGARRSAPAVDSSAPAVTRPVARFVARPMVPSVSVTSDSDRGRVETARRRVRVDSRTVSRGPGRSRSGRVRGCSSTTARPSRVRLTRRGRVVLVLTAVLAIGIAGVSGAALGSVASDPVPQGTSTVRVEPGETLWGIAQRVDADADVRAVVRRIAELNDLAEGEALSPGRRLTVPSVQ